MRRAGTPRALLLCAGSPGGDGSSRRRSRESLAQRLRILADLVDGTRLVIGVQPVFAEAAGDAGPARLRTRTIGVGDRRAGRPVPSGSFGAGEDGRTDKTIKTNTTDTAAGADTTGRAERVDTGGGDAGNEVAEDHVETWRLVERAQTGDGDAFGLLYDRYFDMVWRYIYFRLGDRTLAEDFTSETFVRALRRIGTISYQGRDIGAWFVTIARNIVLDHKKSARNRLETTTGETIESREQVPSTENAVLTTLQNEQLMAAVAQLGEEQRECVTLRFVHGLSVNETASVMGKNDGAIKALQHRAVRKLADLVDRP